MAEPTVMLSDTAEKSLADFSYAPVLPAEAVSYHRRGNRVTRSERRREARTHVSKHPSRCPEEEEMDVEVSLDCCPQHVGI